MPRNIRLFLIFITRVIGMGEWGVEIKTEFNIEYSGRGYTTVQSMENKLVLTGNQSLLKIVPKLRAFRKDIHVCYTDIKLHDY